jgi:hypothetical protein
LLVQKDKDLRITQLFQYITPDRLAQHFDRLKKETPGVDGVCCAAYQENLKENVSSLHARLASGAQRALPAK